MGIPVEPDDLDDVGADPRTGYRGRPLTSAPSEEGDRAPYFEFHLETPPRPYEPDEIGYGVGVRFFRRDGRHYAEIGDYSLHTKLERPDWNTLVRSVRSDKDDRLTDLFGALLYSPLDDGRYKQKFIESIISGEIHEITE